MSFDNRTTDSFIEIGFEHFRYCKQLFDLYQLIVNVIRHGMQEVN